jgi:hypothetical protein
MIYIVIEEVLPETLYEIGVELAIIRHYNALTLGAKPVEQSCPLV